MAFLSEKLISASGGVQEATDDSFNLVTSLFNFDGSNGAQNNTFLDSSSNAFSVTRAGNSTQGTFSPFSSEEGKWSIEFDGSVYCSSATSDDFEFGTGDYTIEAWVWKNTTGQQHVYDGRWPDNDERILFYVNSSDKLAAYIDGTVKGAATSDFPLNQWVHIALTRSGTTGYLFQNGSQVATWTGDSVDIEKPPYSIFIGRDSYGSNYYWNGFMSNIRVLKGTAAYTGSSYSVPTSPLTAITNTKLLTARMNRFIDSSTSAHVMTNNGIGVTPFSPFAPSAAYDAAVNGGSGYFSATADYASIAASSDFDVLSNGTFTIDFWFYRINALGLYADYVGIFNGVSSGVLLYQYSTGFHVYINGSTVFNVTHPKLNEWVHVALTRDGTTLRLFLNGVLQGSSTASLGTSNYPLNVAGDSTGRVGVQGYVSDVRVIKGTAVYTSAFSPPTAPSTAITNTEALLSFTNAAIFDQSGKTNVETVGNAQLDTSVKKFGTASAEFDGTGDYLFLPPQPTLSFPSDFTIEFFFNSDVFQSDFNNLRALVSSGKFYTAGNNGNWILRLSTNARIAWASYDGTGSQVYQEFVMSTMSTGTWYHLAVVRNSGNIQIYLNGTASTSSAVADSKNLIDGANNGIYIGYANLTANNDYDGYIDEFRITQKARYTSNFTAPTKAFPNL